MTARRTRAQIEADIAAERAALSGGLGTLTRSVPGLEGLAGVLGAANGNSNLLDLAVRHGRKNPGAAALIGLGVAWMFLGRDKPKAPRSYQTFQTGSAAEMALTLEAGLGALSDEDRAELLTLRLRALEAQRRLEAETENGGGLSAPILAGGSALFGAALAAFNTKRGANETPVTPGTPSATPSDAQPPVFQHAPSPQQRH